MKEKKELTAEQIYKKNQSRVKTFKILGPVIFWFSILLTVIFVILAFANSIGNITEILDLLNKDKYSGEELAANYQYLVGKWGEWELVGEGMAGLVIRYVNVGNALFSGLMVTFSIFAIISLLLGIVFGKIVFPSMIKYYTANNESMVDIATLKSAQQIDEITKNKKEWF